ncbi:MAG: aliphatic sulfonate ABC transporter substrate-binding protein [Pseudomonadota bacterium]
MSNPASPSEAAAGLTRRGLVALSGAATLAACARPAPSQLVLRIGYQKNGVLLVAKTTGDLERALQHIPASTTWSEFQSGPPLLEALNVGSVDFGGTGDTPPIFAQAAGASLVYAASQRLRGGSGGVLTPANSKARSVADLRGKRVAYTRGTSAHNAAAVSLERAGLSFNDITSVNLSPADAAAAFAQGGIDAWYIWDPYFTAAREQQHARVLETGADIGGGYSFFLANRGLAERQPALLRATLDALAQEGRWAEAHRQDVAQIMARETGLSLPLLQDTVQRADFAIQPMTPDVAAFQQRTADRFLSLGILPHRVDVAAAVWNGWTGAT